MKPFVAPRASTLQILRRRLSLLLLMLAGLLLPAAARAQVSFDGVQRTLASFSSSYTLSPVAVDAQGDAFFVASNGATNILYESPLNGSLTALNSAFPFSPDAIAVNPAGTVLYFIYFGSTLNCGGYVFLATAPVSSGTTPTNMPCSFLLSGYTVAYSNPSGLAVDPSGNLWVADFGGPDLYEIAGPVSASSVPTKFAPLASGQPFDIAVNGNGEVYLTFLGSNGSTQELAEIAASSLTTNILASPVTPTAVVANVPDIVSGLAVDLASDIYVGGGSAADSEVSGSSLVPVYGNFVNGTYGLATDSGGDLFIDGSDGTGTQFVVELNRKAANFGSQAVGSTSSALSLDFTIDASTTVGSIGILTLGKAGLDFADAGSSSCTAMAYSSLTFCDVNVKFKPLAAGLRQGAVVFFSGANNTGTVLGMAPVYGIGTGPQIAYGPGTATAIAPLVNGTALSLPTGVAVDGAGDLFIADFVNSRVVEVPAGGGTAVAIDPTVNGKSLVDDFGVAMDGAGDLFIADYGNSRVVEVPAGGGTAIAIDPTVNGEALNGPTGAAVDGAGDLFIADYSNNRVAELPSGGGAPIAIDPTVNGEALSLPIAVTVDGAGDLFIADRSNNRVVEVPAGGGTPTSIDPSVNGKGLNLPYGVAVDGAGDLFIADYNNSRVVEVPAGGGTPVAIVPTVNGEMLADSAGVAVDAAGDLFIADTQNSRVVELQRSQPPALSFATTPEDSTSTDSPRTVEIQNIGNQALDFTALSYPTDFPEAGGDADACTGSSSLNPGQQCDLPIDFTPQNAGSLSEKVMLTDNALNVTGAMQSIGVSGTGLKLQTITFKPAQVRYGTAPINLSSYASASSGLAVTFQLISGPATLNGSLLTITAAGAVVVQASQGGNGTYAAATTVQQTITVLQAILKVAAYNYTRVYATALPTSFAYSITGLVNGDTAATAYSGAPSVTTTAVLGSPAGNYPITPTTGTLSAVNYTFQFTAGTLTITKATLTVAAYNYTRVYATALPTSFKYSISGFVNGDTQSVVSGTPSITTAAKQGSPVGTYPITPALGSLSATSYTFQFTAGSLTITKATLTVAAYNYSRVYATALPTTFAYSISGFVNGDSQSVVSGTPSITTAAKQGSPVGTYPITPTTGSLSALNYSFQFTAGTLTITKATLTVAAYNYTRTVGQALPNPFAYSITGFVNGDPPSVVTGKPSITSTAVQGSPAGTYPIIPTIGTLAATNYTFAFVDGTLTITQ